MLGTPKSQRGMTAISMLLIGLMAGFVLLIVIKLVPTYLAQFKVKAALNGLTSDIRAEGATDQEIKTLILKKLEVDDVEFVKDKDIVITKHAGGARTVTIDYEARVPLFANVDAVVKFDKNSVELTK